MSRKNKVLFAMKTLKMEPINALRLVKLLENELSADEMHQISGGHCGTGNNGCGCGCQYEGQPGGSTSFENHQANFNNTYSPSAIGVIQLARY